jgi:hypothetical protein
VRALKQTNKQPQTHTTKQTPPKVEELSAAAGHLKAAGAGAYEDPLDKFCGDNPDADECR